MEPLALQLSVIVPITGRPDRIINLLSWLPQFEKINGEVILVHDLSDGATSQLLARTVGEIGNDFNLTLIEGRFGSPGAARNAGKSLAQGAWTTFWDCDDVPNLESVRDLLDNSTNSKFDFLCGSFNVIDIEHNSSRTTHTNSGDAKIDLKKVALNPGIWRFFFKSPTIKEFEFLEISMAEDQDFLLDYNLSTRHGLFTPKITYSYYIGEPGQITKKKSALNDLQISIDHINFCRKTRGRDIYLEIIYLRQLLTGILRGSFRIKAFCSYKFFLKTFDLGNHSSLVAFGLVFSPIKRKLVVNV